MTTGKDSARCDTPLPHGAGEGLGVRAGGIDLPMLLARPHGHQEEEGTEEREVFLELDFLCGALLRILFLPKRMPDQRSRNERERQYEFRNSRQETERNRAPGQRHDRSVCPCRRFRIGQIKMFRPFRWAFWISCRLEPLDHEDCC